MSRKFVFSDLGDIIQGIPLSRYRRDDGTPERIINVGDLECLYIESDLEQIPLVAPNVKRYQVRENDVVIAVRGTLLKSSVVTKATQGSIAGSNVVFFRPGNLTPVNSTYLAVLLRSKWFRQHTDSLQKRSSTTLPAVRVTEVRELEIPLPEVEIQNKIVHLFHKYEQYAKKTLEMLRERQELNEIALFQNILEEQC